MSRNDYNRNTPLRYREILITSHDLDADDTLNFGTDAGWQKILPQNPLIVDLVYGRAGFIARISQWRLLDFKIPFSWYPIDDGLNTLTLVEDPGGLNEATITATIPIGNYTLSEIVTELKSQLDDASIVDGNTWTYTVTSNSASIITIEASGGNFDVISSTSNYPMRRILGLHDFGSDLSSASNILSGTYPVRLYGHHDNIIMRINQYLEPVVGIDLVQQQHDIIMANAVDILSPDIANEVGVNEKIPLFNYRYGDMIETKDSYRNSNDNFMRNAVHDADNGKVAIERMQFSFIFPSVRYETGVDSEVFIPGYFVDFQTGMWRVMMGGIVLE